MNCEIPDLDENAHWIFGCTDSDPFDSNSPCIAECVEGYTSISAGDGAYIADDDCQLMSDPLVCGINLILHKTQP